MISAIKTRKEKIDLVLENSSKIINPVIKKILNSCVDKRHHKIIEYQIFTGGKRLRPALALICCQLLGGEKKDVLSPAAGLEILHNYSLIIDDIIDKSRYRREKPTLWAKFGDSVAQCVAIDYSASVFQAANNAPKNSIQISELFAKTMKTIVDGEILDILLEQSGREGETYISQNRCKTIEKKDYLRMVYKKTAVLFQISCEIGGICSGAEEERVRALREYGFNLGMAFQIKDDILDIFGDGSFDIGKDIIEKKRGNIVVVFALKELFKNEKDEFLEIMSKKEIKNKDIKRAIELIKKTKSCRKSYQLGESFVKNAKEILKFLPQNKWNDILREIADFAMERER